MEQNRWRDRSRLVRWWRLAGTARPRTFNQKVRYKMLRDHRPLLATFADKAAVRSYVAAAVGEGYLPQAYAILDDPAEVTSLDLPEEYVIKPTHASGAVVVVSAHAPADARLPEPGRCRTYCHVRPDAFATDDLVRVCAEWLGQPYGQGPNQEWAYWGLPRRILVEELLSGPAGGIPDDYKLFVFSGRVHYVQVCSGRFGVQTEDFYRPTWERLPLSAGRPSAPTERPARLAEMIQIAERLGAGTDFVRVDLYVLRDRLVVGELTNYPAGGAAPFHPPSFDREFGRPWRVPRRYR
ncbi:MAG: ATP-grasp fold amidoligase family protein [Actinomycetes bacterium]